MKSSTPKLGELKLTSLQELSYLAAAQPYDTFWRAVDIALVTFETLQILPERERAQYRIETVNTCETVLSNVQRLGRKRLAGDGRKQIERISNIMAQFKTHARSEADFGRDLTTLKQIIKERPGGVVGGGPEKNINANMGSLYGMNLGDGGSVNFGPPVQKSEESGERNEDNAETGETGEGIKENGMEHHGESNPKGDEATQVPEDEPKVQDDPKKRRTKKKGWLGWAYDLVMHR